MIYRDNYVNPIRPVANSNVNLKNENKKDDRLTSEKEVENPINFQDLLDQSIAALNEAEEANAKSRRR